MLNAFSIIVADEFLDLALVILALVQRNADRTIGRDHRLAEKTRRLALDVEIFLFDEAEDAAVEIRPHPHLPAPDIVGQMVDDIETDRLLGHRPSTARDLFPSRAPQQGRAPSRANRGCTVRIPT